MPQRQTTAQRYLVNQEDDESRYRLTELAFDDTLDRIRFQAWKIPPLRLRRVFSEAIEGRDYTRHAVGPGEIGRMDLIANTYYQDVTYWWVIAEMNDIQNPLMEMYPGQQLLIPLKEDVINALVPEE